jgi:hypothetical protein
MSDSNVLTPSFLNPWMRYFAGGPELRSIAVAANPASAAWPAANTALYIPFNLPWPYQVRRAFWCNGTAVVSNMDIGIYSLGGAQIWHSGSTAQAGASLLQFVTPATPILLNPGYYVLALNCSGTTNAITAAALTAIQGRLLGLYQQAVGAIALPGSAAFAAYASLIMPICGITRTASGF